MVAGAIGRVFGSRSARRGWIGFGLFFPSLLLMLGFLFYP